MSLLHDIITSCLFANHYTSAVILAAGVGSRFGNEDGTKQNALVGGVPAVVRCALAFEECSIIREIILVGRKEEIETLKGYVKEYNISKVTSVVVGGESRDRSAENGFKAVNKKCEYVAIHDGARCLVTPEIIEKTTRAAWRYGAAAAAESVVDTVKIADKDGFIASTVDRDTVRLVKTPQIFKKNVYLVSLECAKRDKAQVTDDCMMAERAGFKIKLVDCGHDNIKLTERSDLKKAEYILESRKKEGQL